MNKQAASDKRHAPKRNDAGFIPPDWSLRPIREIAPLQRGFDLPTSQIRSGTHPVVYSNGALHNHERAMIKGPGVVTGRSGTIGKVHFIENDYWPHNTTLWVTSFLGNDPKFIYYLYTHIDFSRFLAGSGVPTLNRNDVHRHLAVNPSPSEQRAIAEALSDMDDLLFALERLITKKEAIKQAAMQQLLTGKTRLPGFSGKWETKRLGDICTFLPTANNPHADLKEYGEVGYIHYGEVHTYPHSVLNCISVNLPCIEKDRVESAAWLQDGDLVMADASEDMAGVGKSIEVSGIEGRRIVAGLHTILHRGKPGCWATGFKAYLQFIPAFKSTLTKIATGISVYAISSRQLSDVKLALPSLEEQKAIVAVLSDMDAEIAALERRRDKTRTLKQGMMQQLLTGRVRLVRTREPCP